MPSHSGPPQLVHRGVRRRRGGACPTLVTNGIGGQPSVRFDGVDDHFSLNAGFEDFTAGSTMYVVSRSSALQSGFKLVALGNGAGQQNMVLGRAGNSDGLQYFTTASTGNYGWFNTSAALTTNEINVIRVDQAGGAPNDVVTATVSVNGAEVGSGSVFVPPVTTRSTNYIGKSYWNEGRFQGDIAEILLYNRTLTPAEHAAIETHINNTYSGDPAPDPVPDTPTGLIATAGDATVELGWNPIDGADGYKLYRTTNGNTPTEIADVATPGHTDTGVTNDTAYTYTVTAYNTTGESTPTTGTSATPTAPEPEPVPDTPTGLIATAGDATVELGWNPIDGADGYKLYRTTNGNTPTEIADVATPGHTDTGVTNDTAYTYTVTAYNTTGESTPTTGTSATPTAPEPEPVPDTPTGLIATAGDATVELGWNPIDGADGYKLYRTTNGNTPTEIADVATPGHTDTGVTNDTAYTYTVTAYNTTGESTPTTGTSATPTAPEPEPDPVIPTDGLVLSLDATELADDPGRRQRPSAPGPTLPRPATMRRRRGRRVRRW